jgi:1,4-alpha-glucan branching enzyme
MSDEELERRLRRALSAPVDAPAHAREAIMQRVRHAAREDHRRRMMPPSFGRTARHSLIGVALAAGIGSVTTLSSLVPVNSRVHGGNAATSVVIGDSVVDRLRDTLRLVRLMFDDPAARHVAVVGDFNAWRADATPMRQDPVSGKWETRLALAAGEHRYAIVVDNTRWVGDSTPRQSGNSSRVYSLLHVAHASN